MMTYVKVAWIDLKVIKGYRIKRVLFKNFE